MKLIEVIEVQRHRLATQEPHETEQKQLGTVQLVLVPELCTTFSTKKTLMLAAASSPPASAFPFHIHGCTHFYTLSVPFILIFVRVTFILAVNHSFHLRGSSSSVSPHRGSVHRLHLPFTSTTELQSRDQDRKKIMKQKRNSRAQR